MSFIKFAIISVLAFALVGYITADATNPDNHFTPSISSGVSEKK